VDAKNSARLSTTFKFLSPPPPAIAGRPPGIGFVEEAKYEDYIHLDGIIASYDELDKNSQYLLTDIRKE